jgi:RNA polymerase sigma factor (sigma-70 family)
MNIAELVIDAKKGSAAAQRVLFDFFADRMLLVCLRYLKHRQDAEEILLDGFYKFFKNLNGFNYQGEAALYAWLKKIMVNECLMFLRKRNVLTMTAESAAEEIPLQEIGLDQLSANEILKTLSQLPIGYRTVFNLHVIEGMEHKEVAALMGISEGTSRSQLSKAKSLLQKLLLQKELGYGQRKSK